MKSVYLFFSMLFFSATCFSQTRAELLAYTPPKSSVDSVAEELANLALQNPGLRSIEASAKSYEYNWKASKFNLLNDLTIAGNLNEFTIKGRPETDNGTFRSLVYPRYNFGLRIAVGDLFSNGKTVKSNYYRYQSEVERLNDSRENIKLQVKTAYQNFAYTQHLIALQQEVLQDGLVALTQAEEKFKNGELSLELYTATSKNYNGEQVNEATLEKNLSLFQASLEALIGMPLKDAFIQLLATSGR